MTTEKDGPSMLHYVEQRFAGIDATQAQTSKAIEAQFSRLEQLFTLGQDNAKRAVDKAEATQAAHNLAANEWRSTLNDFKSTLVNRSEFDRFYSEFSAYRLEQSRQQSLSAGAKQEKMEAKEDWKSILALVVAVASIVVTFLYRHI